MDNSENIFAKVGLVLAAAGSGTRFGTANKLLCELDGKPVFCHSLERFLQVLEPKNVAVVISEAEIKEFQKILSQRGISGIILVIGGKTRQESVYRGIKALPSSVEVVAIQDAARPFTTVELLKRCIESTQKCGSGVAARRVVNTIKVADTNGKVCYTPTRDSLWAAETPQVFKRDLIEPAYSQALDSGASMTDDAQALEINGTPVFLVENKQPNRKITFAEDLNSN